MKVWKKSLNRILDIENKLDIPFDHFIFAEEEFFSRYKGQFTTVNFDEPKKGTLNVFTLKMKPTVVAKPAASGNTEGDKEKDAAEAEAAAKAEAEAKAATSKKEKGKK